MLDLLCSIYQKGWGVMLRILMAAALALCFFAGPASANTANPIFGSAKTVALSNAEASKVTAKGGTAAYYIYLGLYYSGYATVYGSLAERYNYLNVPTSYAAYAYVYAYYSYINFYYAYYYRYY
jgi:hypothetical protein